MADTWDFLIVGSGFGGSVSALRLVEKGYVANQVRLAMERWMDEAVSNIIDCFLEDELDEYVDSVRVYACTQQFEVIYRE